MKKLKSLKRQIKKLKYSNQITKECILKLYSEIDQIKKDKKDKDKSEDREPEK